VALHPRESRYGRGEFLARSAAGVVGFSSLSTILAACSNGSGTSAGALKPPGLQLPSPSNPVTHPILADNPMVASGLEPESGTLKIYNWNGYLWPRIKKDFAKEYGVQVEETYFDTMDEAIQKIAQGSLEFDVFFPTIDRVSRLIVGKLLQPLNHEYLPNLANVWPALRSPWYDRGSHYTVPYVTWTTGIGYRTDHVSKTPADFANPYEIYWDETNRGKTYLLDDGRDAPAHMLLKEGIRNVNTDDPAQIDKAKKDLESLIGAVNIKLSTNDYTNIPEDKAWVHQMWSGSAVSAQWYLPEGTGPEVLGYWFPSDGRGVIGSDMMAIPRSAKNPVLAHHFLNYLLDVKNGYANFSNFVGYQPPFTALNPDKLVKDGVVPANLRSAIVRQSDFNRGYVQTELSPATQTLWQNAWAEFKAGV
jgi:spermidine/putrescine transport system substrate-binding protein